MRDSRRLYRMFVRFADGHGERKKDETYLVTVGTRGIYPSRHRCIDARWATHIEVVKLEGKPEGDQDYRSERISVMVARQDSGEN